MKIKRPEAQVEHNSANSIAGMEGLFDVPSVDVSTNKLPQPELAKVAVGILAWPIAKLNKQDRFSGYTVRKFVQEDGLTAAIEHVVTPDPKLGMPTMLSLRLLFVIMKLGYEMKEQMQVVPEFIPVGSWNGLCEILGMQPVQANRALLKSHLQILHSTAITSKKAFKTSRNHEGYSGKFFLLPELKIKGTLDENGNPYDQTYVSISKPLRESIENNYVKTIDLEFIATLKTDIAQLLYTKLSYLFQESLKRGWTFIEFDYRWLAESMGIVICSEKWLAKKQLGPAFKELIRQSYVTEPVWNEWTIRLSPGLRFNMGENAQLKERRKAVTQKKSIFKTKTNGMPPPANIPATANDERLNLLTRQAAWILTGKEPDVKKLEQHGWTVQDALAKAAQLKSPNTTS